MAKKKNFYVEGIPEESTKPSNMAGKSSREKLDNEKIKAQKKIDQEKKLETLSIEDHIKRISENWEALEDRVVIFPDVPALMSKGGLYLPATSVAKPSRGTIVCLGPGEFNKLERMKGISVGDRAVYGRFAGTDVELDGHLYTIVRITDVMLREKKK